MAGGGGPLDIFNAFGSAASGLGDLLGGAVSGSGGQGVTPSGSVLPQNATGDILTNPTVTSQIAQQSSTGDQPSDVDQQIQQAQQAQRQPTFTPPPQQAPAQVTQGQTPEQLGWIKQQNTAPWPQQPSVDPSAGGTIAPGWSAGMAPQPAAAPAAATDTGGGDVGGGGGGQTGGQQAGGQQAGGQQQKTPWQRAGKVLKGLAAQNAAVSGVRGAGAGIDTGSAAAGTAPSNVAPPGGGGSNPLDALISLLTGGTGALGQGLRGIADQVGPPSGATSQSYLPQGYGYGAGPPPSPATAQQQAAPQPPVSTAGQQATAAAGNAPVTPAGSAPDSAAAKGAAAGTLPPGIATFPGAARGETAPTPPAGVYGIAQIPNEVMVRKTQLAGTDTQPTAGFSRVLREQRAPMRQEIERNPRLRAQLAAMATLEHASDPTGPIESVMNRTAALRSQGRNVSLDQMVNSRFYGPFRTGQMQQLAARYAANPGSIPRQYNVAIDTVLSGSNILGGATDQGSGRDPNVGWRGGKVVRDRETYNDWGGGLGHEGNARWRRETQRRVQEEMRGGTQVAQAQPPLTGPPPSPLLDRLREQGQQPTPTPPGVIPTNPKQLFDPRWGPVGVPRADLQNPQQYAGLLQNPQQYRGTAQTLSPLDPEWWNPPANPTANTIGIRG
jgi:hypothetical protein